MGIFPTTLQDIFRLLVQPLHIAAMFPATVLVFFNTYLIIPIVYPEFQNSPLAIPLSLIAIIVLSYLLYVLNGPLIRFAEGYTFERTPIGECKKRKWLGRYDDLIRQIDECDELLIILKKLSNQFIKQHPEYEKPAQFEADPGFHYIRDKIDEWTSYKRSLEAQRQFYYPAYREDTIPTRLGNVVVAFESYAYNRYGMDAIYIWPRLTPILQAEGYAIFVEQEKAAFDFLLNLGYVSLFVGIELTFVFMLTLQPVHAFVALVLAPIIAYGFYLISHTAAIHWGGRMKAAFDLYRESLREVLRIRKPVSFDDERKLWQKLSNFYRSADTRFEEFDYYRQSLPIVISESTGIQVSKVTVEEKRDRTRFALIVRNQNDRAIDQVKVIDFVESDSQPCDITISDPHITLIHRCLDDWANAYQWTLGPIVGGSTIIVTYSLSPIDKASKRGGLTHR